MLEDHRVHSAPRRPLLPGARHGSRGVREGGRDHAFQHPELGRLVTERCGRLGVRVWADLLHAQLSLNRRSVRG